LKKGALQFLGELSPFSAKAESNATIFMHFEKYQILA
jgi:hypothetical protein